MDRKKARRTQRPMIWKACIPTMVLLAMVALPTGLAKDKGIRPEGTTKGEAAKGEAEGNRREGDLKAGDMAPDFTLRGLEGKPVALSSFRGEQPVFLIFGSYT